MKKEDFLLSFNNIEDKYIEEARPALAVKRKRTKKLIVLAACIAAIMAFSLFLFVPYSTQVPGVGKYSGNEYYDIIEKLNVYYYELPEHKNNFEAIVDGVTSVFRNGLKGTGADSMEMEDAGSAPSLEGDYLYSDSVNAGSDQSYEEVTDNQVKGVTEGDLFKRSDKYIYYLDGAVLRVYSIEGKESVEIGKYDMSNVKADGEASGSDMIYLSEDCTTVTVILNYYNYKKGLKSAFSVISLDVTDPMNIKQKNVVEYVGNFVSARLVDGNIYVISKFYRTEPENYKNVKDYVPYVITEDGESVVSADRIYAPEVLSSSGYTVLTELDEKTLELKDDFAVLSFYDPVIYVTKDSIYLTRDYNEEANEETKEGKFTVTADMTEICRIGYGEEGFKNLGSVIIEGSVNDQYSMDEYNGILRVFTSTNLSKTWQTENGMYGFSTDDTGINASLYCVDINTLKVVSSVERFAPKGENVKSARFDGNTAFVCTAVQLTDPVFFFDLSNLDNITYKETGTVEGFSTSLVNFGEGYLLGIGQKNWSTPKIEIYKENDEKVVSVAAIEMPDSYISADYKAYYIDRERGYIGLGVLSYNYNPGGQSIRYVVFKFENEQLSVAYEFNCSGNSSVMRGTYIDECVYVLYKDNIKVIAESELK